MFLFIILQRGYLIASTEALEFLEVMLTDPADLLLLNDFKIANTSASLKGFKEKLVAS